MPGAPGTPASPKGNKRNIFWSYVADLIPELQKHIASHHQDIQRTALAHTPLSPLGPGGPGSPGGPWTATPAPASRYSKRMRGNRKRIRGYDYYK